MTGNIALLCMLHPASMEKQDRCLDLLRHSAREYYRLPTADCTTWSYFLPFPPPKKSSTSSKPLIIGGLEIYTTKAALQAQVDDPVFFQSYHDTVRRENLYSAPEVLQAWFPAEGFMVRDVVSSVSSADGNALVSVTRMACLEGRKEEVMGIMSPFAGWVLANEPDVLTYYIFTRPKAPNELLLFVRYRNVKALKGHSNAPEHVALLKQLETLLEKGVDSATTLWKEVEDSFVSENVGEDIKVLPKL